MSTIDLGIPWARRLSRASTRHFRAPSGTTVSSHQASGFSWIEIRPVDLTQFRTSLIYLHGGGYVIGSPESCIGHLGALIRATGWRVLAPRYPLAPEAAISEIRAHVVDLVQELAACCDSGTLLIGGDSAGGALAVYAASALSVTRFGGLLLLSPWVEPAASDASIERGASLDVAGPDFLDFCHAQAWSGAPAGTDSLSLAPDASFDGVPVFIAVGSDEMLLDQVERLGGRLREACAEVTVLRYSGSPHTFWTFRDIDPNADALVNDIADWAVALGQLAEPSDS